VFAGVAATAARRSASAEEGALAIERDRRLEERRPHISAKLDGTGEHRVFRVGLDSDEALTGMSVEIKEHHFYRPPSSRGGWDCEFNPRVFGVVVPQPGEPAVHAFSYDPYTGNPAGLQPHDSISWAVNTKDRLEWVRLKVTCKGAPGESWDFMLKVKAQPEIADTVA
jgi:hypothetical protein